MHILIVDDDEVIRPVWTKMLQRAGHQVMSASRAQEALDYLRQAQPLPNLILLDLMMPTMDGLQFLKELKQEPLLANVPVIVISGAELERSRFAPFGIVSYLQKPFTLKELLATVAQFDA